MTEKAAKKRRPVKKTNLMTKEQRRESFIAELKKLCRKYKIVIEGDNLPGLYGCHLEEKHHKDKLEDLDILNFRRF